MTRTLKIFAVVTVGLLLGINTSHAQTLGTAGFEESEGYPGSGGGINGVVDADIGTWSAGGNVTDSAIFRAGAQSALGDGTLTLDLDAATKAAIQAADQDIRISFSMYWPDGADMRMNGFGGTNDSMTGELWQFRIKSNGDIHFQTDLLGNDTGAQNDVDTPATNPANQWVDFMADIDVRSSNIGLFNSLQYRVGNDPFKEVLSTQSQFRDRNEGTHINRLAFNNDNNQGDGGARFDNIVISVVPTVWVAPSVDFTWNIDSFGEWATNHNWTPSGGPPGNAAMAHHANHTATFGSAITSDRTVITETAVSARAITFDNSNTYSIAGNGSVNLIAATVTELSTAITTLQGTHQFQANVQLHNDTSVDVASGSALEFNNRLFLHGNILTKIGGGTMAINNNVSTSGGTVNCAEGTCSGTGTIGGDLINDGGTISPGNSLLVDGSLSVVPEPASIVLLLLGLMGAFSGRPQRIITVSGCFPV